MAIWQFISLSSTLSRDSATALASPKKSPSGVVVEIIHFCSHALHFSTAIFLTLITHTLHGAILTPNVIALILAMNEKKIFMVRFNFFFCSLVCTISVYVCKMHLWLFFFSNTHLVLKKGRIFWWWWHAARRISLPSPAPVMRFLLHRSHREGSSHCEKKYIKNVNRIRAICNRESIVW